MLLSSRLPISLRRAEIHENSTNTASVNKTAKKFLWSLIGDPTKAADTKHNHPVHIEYFGAVFEKCFGPIDSGIYGRIKSCWNNSGFIGCLDNDTAEQKVTGKGYAIRISTRKSWGLQGKFVLCVRPNNPTESKNTKTNWHSLDFDWDVQNQHFYKNNLKFQTLNDLTDMIEGAPEQQKEVLKAFDFREKVTEIPKNENRRWIELHDGLYRPLDPEWALAENFE